jgi:hypothetical protein
MQRSVRSGFFSLIVLAAVIYGCGSSSGGNAENGDDAGPRDATTAIPDGPSLPIEGATDEGGNDAPEDDAADATVASPDATLDASDAQAPDAADAAPDAADAAPDAADAAADAGPCTNLCLQQTKCPAAGVTTTLTGKVYAPNGVDPLPNVAVFVPNGAVPAFSQGVACDQQCGLPLEGSPLVSTTSKVDGSFVLPNAPAGANIPLVFQIGRWRRKIMVPMVTSCATTKVSAALSRLPKNKTEGDIPLMAFATGDVDALECVMRKIGVDDSEFTASTGTGRIHLYEGLTDPSSSAAGGAETDASTTEDTLWQTQEALDKYDMVFFPCQGDQTTRTPAAQARLTAYTKAGGRVFATHFSYVWLYNDPPFSGTAAWKVEQHPNPSDQVGFIDQTFPGGKLLAQWLVDVNASATLGQIPLQAIKHDYDSATLPSQSWLTIDDPIFPGASVDYTFTVSAPSDGGTKACGRVLFNDFHVENVGNSNGAIFPAECAPGAMTAQEKLLEFQIFDLDSCVDE